MKPLPELFSTPFVGPHHKGDIALPVAPQFAGPAAVYYNGRPAAVEFVRLELAAAGVPVAAAEAFLASSRPAAFGSGVKLGLLGDLGRSIGGAISRIWNPDDHPRAENGQFGPGGGSGGAAGGVAGDVTDTAPIPATPHLKAAIGVIDAALKRDPIGAVRAAEYRAAAVSVLSAMSPGAVKRLNKHVQTVHFVGTFPEVTKEVRRRLEKLGDTIEVPDGVAGAYIKDDRTLVADGGVPGTRPEEGVHAAGVYAHEIGHALDGPDDQISSSKSWGLAWNKEIVNGSAPPSEYAQKTPSEGLAEFHRVLIANRQAACQMYPHCAAVFKNFGIL